ncbi:MAG TPA: hypothetical protein VEZ15_04175 [Acidimicrobiia bacterium]|nr:hypothetical protein [Acidimicrobiia bacterium]
MHLELADDEAEVLREVLDITLHDLSYEIASADLPSYREMLRNRRRILEKVLDAVGGPIPNSERLDR